MLDNLKEKKSYTILSLALVLYVFVIIWVVIFKLGEPILILESGSIEPPYGFRISTIEYLELSLKEKVIWGFNHPIVHLNKTILDFLTNLLTFMPLGLVLAAMIKKHNVIYATLIGFIFSLIVEMFQLFTLFGTWDVYDLVFNTIGTLLGALLCIMLIKLIPKDKTNIVINIVGIVSIIIMVGLLIYAIISLVNARDIINFKWYEIKKYIAF